MNDNDFELMQCHNLNPKPSGFVIVHNKFPITSKRGDVVLFSGLFTITYRNSMHVSNLFTIYRFIECSKMRENCRRFKVKYIYSKYVKYVNIYEGLKVTDLKSI